MTRNAALVALAGSGASWLTTILVLGNEGLQFAVSGDVIRVFAKPIATLSAAGAAFIASFVVAWIVRLSDGQIRNVVGYVFALDALMVAASIVLVGELELPSAPTIFLVLSAGGLQLLAVGFAVWLVARAVPGRL
jgi:hypothetical protein